tara:strand:- start:127 stop:867 length:741 start_codon:yes stop_codon:yes gene_type:complete
MAFKIKRFIPSSPLNVVDPGKKLTGSQMNQSVNGPKDSWMNDVNNDGTMFTRAISSYKKIQASNKEKINKRKSGVSPTVDQTKSVKNEKLTEGGIQGSVGGGKVKSQVTKDGEAGYEADDKARKNKTGIYAPKQKKTRKKVSAIKTPKAKEIKSTIKASKASDVDVSKKPTVKTVPKDNSRKAIRKRKKADKAAGVSKSQMRANKAKSKSEKALAKSKATKDSVNKAHLKSKSERLAKRAKRKGNS